MAIPLLTTKLYIPPPRARLVQRPRLLAHLNAGLEQGRKLTLVSAPVGFGKTTLITEWVCTTAREVAWISLDESDNDPGQFMTYLIAALQQIEGHIGQTVQQLIQSPRFAETDLTTVHRWVIPLINDIATLPTDILLVLDDYHLIQVDAIHQVLQFLLEHQPRQLHIAIGTREDPPFLLARMRARGQITEVRERDLRFTIEEVDNFLNHTIGLHLPSLAVSTLKERTEGWIAGLQLVALALQTAQNASTPPITSEALLATFTSNERQVTDYLVAEILQRQPEPIRTFLRQTAILDQLTSSLCDAITEREDSADILEQLLTANLLIPLDSGHAWYRYHRLFSESLCTTLNQAEKKSLHARAMRWYEAQGLRSQAIHHALEFASKPEDWATAERLICAGAEEILHRGGTITIRNWLDALPESRVRANGELALYKAWLLATTGEMSNAENYAALAEAHLSQTATPDQNRGKLLALRSFITALGHRDYPMAIDLATQSLRLLDSEQAQWRVIPLWIKAESQEHTNHITEAIDAFRDAAQAGRVIGNQIFAVLAEMSLAKALNDHGKRREAVTICQEVIQRCTDVVGRVSPIASPIFNRMGTLYYEANQLDQARKAHERGKILCKHLGLEYDITYSQSLAAPTLYAQGEIDAALEALHQSYRTATHTNYGEADWFLAVETWLRLKQGELAFATRWAEQAGFSPDDAPQLLHLESHLVYARVLLSQYRYADARRWLARLERFTRDHSLYRWLLSVYILQTLTMAQTGDPALAHAQLARAVELAAPETYIRAFLDEDPQLLSLLPEVRSLAPDFVDHILDDANIPAVQQQITAQALSNQTLIEPLSERELEVLRLIAGGLNNREIATHLFITPGTVKRHINNIYGKLQVHSRTQAVAKARELRVLA